MLISPSKIHSLLSSLLTPSSSSTNEKGPHTALLIYPNGQLVSCVSIPLDNDEEGDDEDETVDQDEDEEEDGIEEPYLESQERKRLLLGLASQWNESESGKMECELGKLHFTYLPLPPLDQTSINGKESLPPIKPYPVDGFVLVLNSTKDVDWKILVKKSREFEDKWKS